MDPNSVMGQQMQKDIEETAALRGNHEAAPVEPQGIGVAITAQRQLEALQQEHRELQVAHADLIDTHGKLLDFNGALIEVHGALKAENETLKAQASKSEPAQENATSEGMPEHAEG